VRCFANNRSPSMLYGRPNSAAASSVAARAIDGVLEAEREAQAAVAVCDRAGSNVLEAARQRARGISERAEARTVALHRRAAKKVELCAASLMEQRVRIAAEAVKQLSEPGRLRLAIERVAAQLTTEAVSSDVA
jgi:hypothetical protein